MFSWIEPGHGLLFLQLSMLSATLAGLGAVGGGLYFLPSPLNEVMQVWGWRQGTARRNLPEPWWKLISLLPRNPSGELPAPSRFSILINFAAEAGDHHIPIPPPLCLLPSPTPSSPAPELDTFPLRSQTSPSRGPLTEQSFIKLFHALSGRGAPGEGGLFRPFVGAPQDRPA